MEGRAESIEELKAEVERALDPETRRRARMRLAAILRVAGEKAEAAIEAAMDRLRPAAGLAVLLAALLLAGCGLFSDPASLAPIHEDLMILRQAYITFARNVTARPLDPGINEEKIHSLDRAIMSLLDAEIEATKEEEE